MCFYQEKVDKCVKCQVVLATLYVSFMMSMRVFWMTVATAGQLFCSWIIAR